MCVQERTPLDVIGYTQLLMKDGDRRLMPTDLIIKNAYNLTYLHVGTIIFVPYQQELVASGRGQQTDFREIQANAVETDNIMQKVLLDFFTTRKLDDTWPTQKLITVSGTLGERLGQVYDGIASKKQFCFNHKPEFGDLEKLKQVVPTIYGV
jgi:hypothetical protein